MQNSQTIYVLRNTYAVFVKKQVNTCKMYNNSPASKQVLFWCKISDQVRISKSLNVASVPIVAVAAVVA